MNLTQLKQTAKQNLSGYWGTAILASVISNFVTSGFQLLGQLITALSSILSIFSFFLLPIQVGLNRFFLDLNEGKKPSVDRVFYGFQNGRYGRNLGTMVLMILLLILWVVFTIFLLAIPAIVKALAYAMTPYILADPDFDDVPSGEVITLSRKMMDGYKMTLFGIQLYYTWWYGLAVGIGTTMVTLGANVDIGYAIISIATLLFTFYTTPLLQSTIAAFYQNARQPFARRLNDLQDESVRPTPIDDPLAWPKPENEDLYYGDPEDKSEPSSDDDDDPFFGK